MTEFEFIQIGEIALSGVGDSAMNIVTVIFAYVVASHFVGKSLSRNAAISISIVYSLWLLGPLAGMYESLDLGVRTGIEFRDNFPDSYAVDPIGVSAILYFITSFTPLILGWVGSLIYMHRYIRKNYGNILGNDT